jgi:succinate dehydrogenase flavin-adding protein (antitoxin of CptAB toxin-antitoxin module)
MYETFTENEFKQIDCPGLDGFLKLLKLSDRKITSKIMLEH